MRGSALFGKTAAQGLTCTIGDLARQAEKSPHLSRDTRSLHTIYGYRLTLACVHTPFGARTNPKDSGREYSKVTYR